jgi:hypothetical protein
VARDGFIRDYRGRRVSRTGKFFMIEKATVWTMKDAGGTAFGTAAFFTAITRL